MQTVRQESEIFSELAELCASPGYIHAIAYLCFWSNTIEYVNTLTSDDILQQFSRDPLVRTEISTLIGLTCKKQLSTMLLSSEIIQKYIDKTLILLKEIHQSMMPPMTEIFDSIKNSDPNFNPFKKGSVLRECIFYCGEAAYDFQYRDFSKIKYKEDNNWFLKNKGFSIYQMIDVVTSIQALHNNKIQEIIPKLLERYPEQCDLLSAYKFTIKEISDASNIEIDIVARVINSFASEDNMDEFNALDDFNLKNAYPIITLPHGEYLLFQTYSLMQALYETPFFWFHNDKEYCSIAMQHRGQFTEDFSAERLKLVFGKERVFLNIDIYNSKKKVGEIDVLVIFANRAIILQAKSKKLTIAARKGNDDSLQRDFKNAIQESYTQAYECATLLNKKDYKLIDSNKNELKIKRNYSEIYLFCVVSDHYPGLPFQARQFLEYQETAIIKAPFIMDIFLLDVITEMLRSPLHFLNYINRRVYYNNEILSSQELTILSYHLQGNLWIDDEYTMLKLGDDVCFDLDVAMLVRREGVPGSDTPQGILTKYKNTTFDQLIKDIEKLEHPGTIDLGFMLLSLNDDSIKFINEGISHLVELGKKDGQNHDLTIVNQINKEEIGLTIHCNDHDESISALSLDRHCELRKYAHKASSWFGICVGQITPKLRFGVHKKFNWVQSNEMEQLVKKLPKAQNVEDNNKITSFNTTKIIKKTVRTKVTPKIGRNEKCSCGSGKKYKKCCMKPAWKI